VCKGNADRVELGESMTGRTNSHIIQAPVCMRDCAPRVYSEPSTALFSFNLSLGPVRSAGLRAVYQH